MFLAILWSNEAKWLAGHRFEVTGRFNPSNLQAWSIHEITLVRRTQSLDVIPCRPLAPTGEASPS